MGQAPICPCGHPVSENNARCSACLERQRIRHSRRSQPHTPPPRDTLRRRDNTTANSVNTALCSAFASEEEDQPTWLPPNVYRSPTRSTSRPRRLAAPTSDVASSPLLTPPSRSSMDGRGTPGGGGGNRAATPEVSSRSAERSYAPFSAGFARLSRPKDSGSRSPPQQRPRSCLGGGAEGGFGMTAKMFAGPA